VWCWTDCLICWRRRSCCPCWVLQKRASGQSGEINSTIKEFTGQIAVRTCHMALVTDNHQAGPGRSVYECSITFTMHPPQRDGREINPLVHGTSTPWPVRQCQNTSLLTVGTVFPCVLPLKLQQSPAPGESCAMGSSLGLMVAQQPSALSPDATKMGASYRAALT